jgi:hypothetical protein
MLSRKRIRVGGRVRLDGTDVDGGREGERIEQRTGEGEG